MNRTLIKKGWLVIALLMTFLILGAVPALAAIDGMTGTTFNLTAKAGYITTPDGDSIFMWGYADTNGVHNGGRMQYPGPTLIVNQNATVTITLTNQLSVPVSIVFPGQAGVTATGGTLGLLTNEAPPGGSVQYQFIASNPGTYTYYSGTRPDLQTEMGLVGALIVRPSMVTPVGFTGCAYNDADSCFQHEYVFLLSEIDPRIHKLVQTGKMNLVDNTTYFPVTWFINGRAAPDTMGPAFASWLPNQPYNSMPMAHPAETVLLRQIGAGRNFHPFHHHGNHSRIIARDGKFLESAPGAGANLSELVFTITSVPGGTTDSLFKWTGEGLGWDVFGHAQVNPDGTITCVAPTAEEAAVENMADHCKPVPVLLPNIEELAIGLFYSGSPFLGALGFLLPGEGGFNPNGGYFFMWHSHAEKEITTNNIFPGGMLTMIVIEHPSVTLMNP